MNGLVQLLFENDELCTIQPDCQTQGSIYSGFIMWKQKSIKQYNGMRTRSQQYCQFCEILQKKKTNNLVIAQNRQCFAFHDLNLATAKAHVLACPKEHIETALDVQDMGILERLLQFGEEVMAKLYQEKYKVKPEGEVFRFGFHLPPHVSIFHIHLHCFILPFQNVMYDKYLYGFGLKSIQTIKQRIHDAKHAKL